MIIQPNMITVKEISKEKPVSAASLDTLEKTTHHDKADSNSFAGGTQRNHLPI